MDSTLLYNKLAALPEHMKSEVADFIDFLISKAKKEKSFVDKPKPKFGSLKGKIHMSPDFDEPLDEFKEYMQ